MPDQDTKSTEANRRRNLQRARQQSKNTTVDPELMRQSGNKKSAEKQDNKESTSEKTVQEKDQEQKINLRERREQIRQAKGLREKTKLLSEAGADHGLKTAGEWWLRENFIALWIGFATLFGWILPWMYIHAHIFGTILAPFFSEKLAEFFVKLKIHQWLQILVVDILIMLLFLIIGTLVALMQCAIDTTSSFGTFIDAFVNVATGKGFLDHCVK